MISKSSRHAVSALTFLARLGRDEYAGANRIAVEIEAPKNYLGKLLNKLAAAGHLESTKGYNGGFRLKKPASRITIYDIVDPIDHLSKWDMCFLGDNKCSCKSQCAVHGTWHKIRADYLKFLKNTTLEMVSEANTEI